MGGVDVRGSFAVAAAMALSALPMLGDSLQSTAVTLVANPLPAGQDRDDTYMECAQFRGGGGSRWISHWGLIRGRRTDGLSGDWSLGQFGDVVLPGRRHNSSAAGIGHSSATRCDV